MASKSPPSAKRPNDPRSRFGDGTGVRLFVCPWVKGRDEVHRRTVKASSAAAGPDIDENLMSQAAEPQRLCVVASPGF